MLNTVTTATLQTAHTTIQVSSAFITSHTHCYD